MLKKFLKNFAHTSAIIMTYILKVIHYCLQIDVFGNFRNKCLEIYERNPIYFKSALGLA